MLFKILLVDDNWYALNHFSNLVNWEELGFTLVGTASDGIEGMELYEEYHPDLIITDIQMPGIDGRELAQKVKSEAPDTEIIFLSSYDEFDYARAAIDLNVYEYILKPELTKEALIQKLKKIYSRISEKKRWEQQQVKGSLTAYFRMSLEELEAEEYRDPKQLKGDACFFMVEQDHVPEQIAWQSGYQVKEADYKILIGRLCEQIPELSYLVRVDVFLWIAIVTGGKDCEKIALAVEEYLRENAAESFSLYLCGRIHTVMECRIRYEELKYLTKQRYFEGAQCRLRAELHEPPKRMPNVKMEELFQLADGLWDREKNAEELLAAIFKPLLYQRDFDSFMRMCCYLIHSMNEITKREPAIQLYDEEILYLLSAKRILQWLRDKILLVRDHLHPNYSHATRMALHYINENYSNPLLSVEMIAANADLSVNRMNDVLKKELGKTAGKYLAEVRAEKACQLLASGMPVQKVSEQAGYSSPSYFSRVFHKMYGVSPQEYQRMKTQG